MSEAEQCRAVTKSGARCTNRSKTSGFCAVHFPKTEKKADLVASAKKVTELAIAVGGVIAVVEKIVQLWQSLPFGAGPEMPADYDYLVEEVGFVWNTQRGSYKPSNRSGSDVNWQRVRWLYMAANRFLEQPPEAQIDQARKYGAIYLELESVIGELPSDIKDMLFRELGKADA
jgi:hypothetical protein